MPTVLRGLCFGLGLLLIVAASDSAMQSADKESKSKSTSPGTEEISPAGRWPGYKVGQPHRYVIWNDSAGWHVRVTSKERTTFAGSIETVGGKFNKFIGLDNLEGANAKTPKQRKDADLGTINADRTRIDFRLVVYDKEDSIDFTLTDKTTDLVFKLRIDNSDQPECIFIGKKGRHPKAVNFKLPTTFSE